MLITENIKVYHKGESDIVETCKKGIKRCRRGTSCGNNLSYGSDGISCIDNERGLSCIDCSLEWLRAEGVDEDE